MLILNSGFIVQNCQHIPQTARYNECFCKGFGNPVSESKTHCSIQSKQSSSNGFLLRDLLFANENPQRRDHDFTCFGNDGGCARTVIMLRIHKILCE